MEDEDANIVSPVPVGTLMWLKHFDGDKDSFDVILNQYGALWVLIAFDEGDPEVPYHCRSLATGHETWFAPDEMEAHGGGQ